MTQKEAVSLIGKGQSIIVQGLIARAWTEGFKQGAEDAKAAAFRAGFADGVKQAVAQSDGYQAGFADGISFANELASCCTWLALHDAFGFGGIRLARFNTALKAIYDTTLHPADLKDRLAAIGIVGKNWDEMEVL